MTEVVECDGKRYVYEPHMGRLDRTKYPANADPFSSIWCVCRICRDYYKDVREAPRASLKAIRSAR